MSSATPQIMSEVVGILAKFTVYGKTEPEILRVSHFIRSDEPGANGSEGIERFSVRPVLFSANSDI